MQFCTTLLIDPGRPLFFFKHVTPSQSIARRGGAAMVAQRVGNFGMAILSVPQLNSVYFVKFCVKKNETKAEYDKNQPI